MEVRYLDNLELNADDHSFSGYFARFYDPAEPGSEYELIPGLFERLHPDSLKRLTRDVVALWNHNHDIPLARVSAGSLTLGSDSKGGKFKIQYDKRDADHRRVKAKIQNRTVGGCSFGFFIRPGGEQFMRDGNKDVRLLTDIDVVEISACTFPAYPATAVKFRSARETEDIAGRYQQWLETEKRMQRIDNLTRMP